MASVEILYFYDEYMQPATDDAYSLGQPSKRFEDLYISGFAYIGSLGQNLQVDNSFSIFFGDTSIGINSADDGHIDFSSDLFIDFNIGGFEQINLQDGKLIPTTDDDIDLGDSTHQYKDGYFDGVFTTDGRVLSTTTKTTTYDITTDDDVIVCNSTTAFTVTLPDASGSGRRFHIKNINTGAVTIEGEGSDTIDDELNQVLGQYDCADVVDYADEKWVVV